MIKLKYLIFVILLICSWNTEGKALDRKNYSVNITKISEIRNIKIQVDIDIDTTVYGVPTKSEFFEISSKVNAYFRDEYKKEERSQANKYENHFYNYFLGIPSKFKKAYAIYSHRRGAEPDVIITYDVVKTQGNNKPKQYTNLKKFSNDLLECRAEDKRFKVINNNTTHVQVSPIYVKGEMKKLVIENGKREIVYTLLQFLSNTSLNKFRIDAVPLDFTKLRNNEYQYKPEFKVSLTTTRKKAEKIITNSLGIEKINELIGNQYFLNSINFKANGLLYNDQGVPTLNKLWEKLKQ